jgi:DNA-binding MarR family transcriptional regulator
MSIEAIGLYLHLLDKTYQKLLSYDLDFTGLERYFFVLWAIHESNEPLSQQNMADLLKVDKASIVRIVDDLEKKGYIKRTTNAEDKRVYFLELDKKGNRFIKDILEGINNLNEEMFIGFSPKEKELFMQLLHKAYQNLSQQPESDFFLKFLGKV